MSDARISDKSMVSSDSSNNSLAIHYRSSAKVPNMTTETP